MNKLKLPRDLLLMEQNRTQIIIVYINKLTIIMMVKIMFISKLHFNIKNDEKKYFFIRIMLYIVILIIY